MGKMWTGPGAGLAATAMVSVVLNRAVGSRDVRRDNQTGPQGSCRWDRGLLVIQGQEPKMSFSERLLLTLSIQCS